jgi:hypothetical protein
MALAYSFSGACAEESTPGEALLPATLEGVFRCPARREYLELRFSTPEGQWNWCFPRPARRRSRPPRPVALTLGPYGMVARSVNGDRGGLVDALDAAVALPMILAGADVVVLRRLVTSGR